MKNLSLIVLTITIIVLGMQIQKYKKRAELYLQKETKFEKYFDLMNIWLELRNANCTVEKFFEDNKYYTIAIYGMGKMGKLLLNELKNSSKVKVLYAIDRRGVAEDCGVKILTINDNLPMVDVIVVTPMLEYSEVKRMLKKKMDNSIVSIEDVIYEAFE